MLVPGVAALTSHEASGNDALLCHEYLWATDIGGPNRAMHLAAETRNFLPVAAEE